jgi:hypothetical protein
MEQSAAHVEHNSPHAGFARSQAQIAASIKSCKYGKLAILGTLP